MGIFDDLPISTSTMVVLVIGGILVLAVWCWINGVSFSSSSRRKDDPPLSGPSKREDIDPSPGNPSPPKSPPPGNSPQGVPSPRKPSTPSGKARQEISV